MGTSTLSKIKSLELEEISVNGGNILKFLKNSDENYKNFGEAYFSFIENKFIKAWKLHTKMTMNLVVPSGSVKFVFTTNKDGPFKVLEIGSKNYKSLFVPPNIWFGFQGTSSSKNIILNFSNIIHDENEVKRLDQNMINYKW